MSIGLAVAGCTSSVTVHVIRAPDAHFERYRTFAFVLSPRPPRAYAASERSADVRAKVEQTAARVLEGRGYVLAAGDHADLVVRIEAGRRAEPITTGTAVVGTGVAGQPLPASEGHAASPGATPGAAVDETGLHGELDREEEDLIDGKFVIDAFDTETRRMVWHGSARAEVPPGPVDEARLERAVERVLASFPARG